MKARTPYTGRVITMPIQEENALCNSLMRLALQIDEEPRSLLYGIFIVIREWSQ